VVLEFLCRVFCGNWNSNSMQLHSVALAFVELRCLRQCQTANAADGIATANPIIETMASVVISIAVCVSYI